MVYSNKNADMICELVAKGEHSIIEIVKSCRVSKATLYRWLKEKPEFAEKFALAKEQHLDHIGELAQSALVQLITKQEYDEEVIEYTSDKDGKPRIKSKKISKKVIMPNPAAVIFTLTNRLPKDWKQKQSFEHTGKDGEELKTNFVINVVSSGIEPVNSESEINID